MTTIPRVSHEAVSTREGCSSGVLGLSELEEADERACLTTYVCVPESYADEDSGASWVLPPQDVIIGSDVICDHDAAAGVARILDMALRPGGEPHIYLASFLRRSSTRSSLSPTKASLTPSECSTFVSVFVTGMGYFVLPLPEHRYGVDALPRFLEGTAILLLEDIL
jgi:hypothetical protein